MNPESAIQPAAAAADHPMLADGGDTRAPNIEKIADAASQIIITSGSMALSAALYTSMFG